MKNNNLKFLEKKKTRLLIFKKNLSNQHWDNHWSNFWHQNIGEIYKASSKSIVCRITKGFLKPKDGPILEGGCGLGIHVHSLRSLNYNIIGIDLAEKTIKMVNKYMPYLQIKLADVQNIPYPDKYFVGYWSLGVIEHFFKGYLQILNEMKRVIKNEGFLFITFPYMSPFRILKSKLKLYKTISFTKNTNRISNHFYQYIFNKKYVINAIEAKGFELKYSETKSGLKGFKDEIFFMKFFFRRFIKLIFENRNKVLALFKAILDKFLSKFFGHSILLVFQKSK